MCELQTSVLQVVVLQTKMCIKVFCITSFVMGSSDKWDGMTVFSILYVYLRSKRYSNEILHLSSISLGSCDMVFSSKTFFHYFFFLNPLRDWLSKKFTQVSVRELCEWSACNSEEDGICFLFAYMPVLLCTVNTAELKVVWHIATSSNRTEAKLLLVSIAMSA